MWSLLYEGQSNEAIGSNGYPYAAIREQIYWNLVHSHISKANSQFFVSRVLRQLVVRRWSVHRIASYFMEGSCVAGIRINGIDI